MCYASMGIGSKNVPLHSKVASKVYRQAILPKMMYGLEIMCLESKHVEMLEICQEKCYP